MPDHLAKRLQRFTELSFDERLFLGRLVEPTRAIMQSAHIFSEGRRSSDVYILTDGYACEYRMLRDGRKQIIRLLLAGDLFNQNALLSHENRSNFIAQTDCQVATIQEQTIDSVAQFPRLAKAWMQADQVDREALLESIVRIGQKPAFARVAHFLCETSHRMRAIGLASGNAFFFPLNQTELGDLLGLSTVHTNRSLRNLVEKNIIKYNQKRITLVDEAALKSIGEFSDDYLIPLAAAPTRVLTQAA